MMLLTICKPYSPVAGVVVDYRDRLGIALLAAVALAGAAASTVQAAGPATPSDDVARGRRVFAQCAACHNVTGRPALGPSLLGLSGRKAAAQVGYQYSAALKRSDIVWTDKALQEYLRAPLQAVPGTKMAFAGVKDDKDRSSLIAYLKTLK